MWLFLSRRFRTWLILAVVLPAMRMLLRRGATFAARRYPNTPAASILGHGDSLLGSAAARRNRRGRRRR